jgi:dienelactone hydrolase
LAATAAPSIVVTPSNVVEGDPVQVKVEGLRPGEKVTLHASRMWSSYPSGHELYCGKASFLADARGVIDLSSSAPLSGSSYDRPDDAGLFWSMRSEKRGSGCGDIFGAAKPDHEGALKVEPCSSRQNAAGLIVARTTAHLRPGDSDVSVREVRDENVTGVFARNGSAAQQPAIIVLGGSEGGLFTARWAAPILASRGFAVLGLGYFQGDETDLSALPANLEHIPLETLEVARDWLARQPGIDPSRIALVGVSKGAELALVAGATFPWVTAVAAFTPTHVVWEGIPPHDQSDRAAGSSWTYKGKPLPFVRWSKAAERRSDLTRSATGSSRMTDIHLESLAEFASDVPAATIPIERSRAAFFIAAGTDDALWPAAYSSELIQRRLARRTPDTSAVFEIHATGHLVMGTGWGPTTQFQRSSGWLQGGNARLDAQAQRAIWPAFIRFLDLHLRTGTQRK